MVCLSTLFSAVILQHCVRWLIVMIFQENNPLPSISLMTCSLFSFFKHSKPALKIILTEDWPVKIVLSHSPGNRDGGLNSPSIERGKTAIVITTQNSDEWVWKIRYLLDNLVVCDIKFTIYFLKLYLCPCAHFRHSATPAPTQESCRSSIHQCTIVFPPPSHLTLSNRDSWFIPARLVP